MTHPLQNARPPESAAEKFAAELQSDERLEWTGQPNTSVIFHPEDLFAIPFSLMWGGFAIFWILGATRNFSFLTTEGKSMGWFGAVWGTPFVIIGQYMIWGRFLYAWWEKKRTYYALTNRRAIMIRHGLTGRAVSSANLEGLSLVDKRVRADGIGSVSFGGPVQPAFQFGKQNTAKPLTFEDIEQADAVHRMAVSARNDG